MTRCFGIVSTLDDLTKFIRTVVLRCAMQMVLGSAQTGVGLDELTEILALQSELWEMRAPTNALGEAVVLDCSTDARRGVYADVIVRHGTLKVGDAVVLGEQVRTL